jgi:universal stress protein A
MSIATHILLGTDFSEAADVAVTKAAELARTLGGKLTVLNVHGPALGARAPMAEDKILLSADLGAESRESLKMLKSAKLADIDSVTLATAEHVSAARAICDYADEHGVDVIVIGTHGRTGLLHVLMGSVAEKVVRHANCPILVVPYGKRSHQREM